MLEAGRELDALVAMQVFRYTLDYEFADTLGAPCVRELRDEYDEWGMLPHYSTDIGDAWLVVDHFRRNGTSVEIWALNYTNTPEGSCSVMMLPNTHKIRADTPALAICRAALAACGVPLESGGNE